MFVVCRKLKLEVEETQYCKLRKPTLKQNFTFVIVVANALNLYTVQSSFEVDIPKSLIIPSCNLKIGATLGQGRVG